MPSFLEVFGRQDPSKAFSHLKGAGAQLIRWAFPLADAAGLRCYVDASKLGHPLYKTCGFDDVGEMTLGLDEYEGGGGLGVQRWVAVVREPRKA